MFNKVSLVPTLETWDFCVFVRHGRQDQRMLCLILPGSDIRFDPNINHIKGLLTGRCQSYHLHNGHRETSRGFMQKA